MKFDVPRQNRVVLWILGIFVLVLLVLLILLQSSNLWKSFTVETASDTLLLYGLSSLNVAAFVVFGFIFLRSIIRLMKERRALQLGSQIKSRLLFYFVLISLLPIVAMAVFSYLFMNRALDRWFSDIPENVVREAREFQNKSKADQYARLQETARMIAISIEERDVTNADLDRIAKAGDLAFAEILDPSNEPLRTNAVDSAYSPELDLIREGKFDDPSLSDGVGTDAAVAVMADGRKLVIAPNFRDSESVGQMVDNSLAEFDRLKEQQVTVRQIGFLTLGVLTFLLIFASSWTAFYIARGLTVPIKALAEGAQRIAHGDLAHRVEVPAEDELALLVWTFNEMSAKLEANAEELNERRRYIETVLLSLPTGVVSLDAADRITTINPSARGILSLNRGDVMGMMLSDLLTENDRTGIERLIARSKRIGHASDQITLSGDSDSGSGNRQPVSVSLTSSALPEKGGVVLVIEDLSELIAAQRASAWQEVARRMAHEIKNPLTPIQLSAERIAKKCLESSASEFSVQTILSPGIHQGVGDDPARRIVKDGTDTILREVQSLKSMVDEFSRFARLPNVKLVSGIVNDVVQQAVSLYQDRSNEVMVESTLAPDLPSVLVDEEQLKRVFVNLIDNAIEAPGDEAEKIVKITSRHELARDIVVIEVSDNGKGIDPGDHQKLFQPYFSTKGRGTGLGLAIVHRIIAEHRGRIKAVPNQPRGARFIIELPTAV